MIDLHRRVGHEWTKEGRGRRKAGLASNHRRKLFVVTHQIPEQIYSSFRYAHRPGSARSRLFVSSERTSRDSSPRLIVRARSNKGTGYGIKERKKKPKQTKLSLLAAEGSSSRPLPSALLLIEATRWRGAKILEMEGKGNGEEEKKAQLFHAQVDWTRIEKNKRTANKQRRNYNVECDTKFCGGSVIQSVAVALRVHRAPQLFLTAFAKNSRSIEAKPCVAIIKPRSHPGLRRDSIWTFVFHCVLLVHWNINCILRK